MCHLENEPEEAHAMNQSILYNHGKKLNQQILMIINLKYIKMFDQYSMNW